MNKAVFLDRDGVINRELGHYCEKVEDFEILADLAYIFGTQLSARSSGTRYAGYLLYRKRRQTW